MKPGRHLDAVIEFNPLLGPEEVLCGLGDTILAGPLGTVQGLVRRFVELHGTLMHGAHARYAGADGHVDGLALVLDPSRSSFNEVTRGAVRGDAHGHTDAVVALQPVLHRWAVIQAHAGDLREAGVVEGQP